MYFEEFQVGQVFDHVRPVAAPLDLHDVHGRVHVFHKHRGHKGDRKYGDDAGYVGV